MPLSPDTEALMLAYVYGELDGDAARAFEARLASDAELRAEVEGMQAVRDLLQLDARHGEESGLDVPPPHLVDAILRAEALARPAEIRDASLLVRGRPDEPRGFAQKLSSWLLGGGVFVTAAAALLVLVARDDDVEAPAAIVAFEQAPAAAPDAVAQGAKDEAKPAAEAKLALPSDDEVAEPSLETEAPKQPAEAVAPAPEVGLLEKASALQAKQLEAKEPETRAREEPELDDKVYDEKYDRRYDKKAKTRPSRASRKARPAEKPAPAKGGALRDVDLDEALSSPATGEGLDALSSGAGLKGADGLAEGQLGLGRGAGGSGAGPGTSSLESAPPPPPATSAPSGAFGSTPPPLPEPARRKAEEQRRERAKVAGTDKRARAKLDAERAAAESEAEMALASAGLALGEGRADEALDLFKRAALFDKQVKVLGGAPYVGQMRAYLALKRPKDAYALWPLVQRYSKTAADRAQGALAAAEAAEGLGRDRDARRLYEEAARFPATKALALKGLMRVRAREQALEAPASDAAAAEASESR